MIATVICWIAFVLLGLFLLYVLVADTLSLIELDRIFSSRTRLLAFLVPLGLVEAALWAYLFP